MMEWTVVQPLSSMTAAMTTSALALGKTVRMSLVRREVGDMREEVQICLPLHVDLVGGRRRGEQIVGVR